MSSLVFKLSLCTNLMNVSPMSDRIDLNTAELEAGFVVRVAVVAV